MGGVSNRGSAYVGSGGDLLLSTDEVMGGVDVGWIIPCLSGTGGGCECDSGVSVFSSKSMAT